MVFLRTHGVLHRLAVNPFNGQLRHQLLQHHRPCIKPFRLQQVIHPPDFLWQEDILPAPPVGLEEAVIWSA